MLIYRSPINATASIISRTNEHRRKITIIFLHFNPSPPPSPVTTSETILFDEFEINKVVLQLPSITFETMQFRKLDRNPDFPLGPLVLRARDGY